MVMDVTLSHGNEVWELYFDVSANEETERAVFEVIPDGDVPGGDHNHDDHDHDHDEHDHG